MGADDQRPKILPLFVTRINQVSGLSFLENKCRMTAMRVSNEIFCNGFHIGNGSALWGSRPCGEALENGRDLLSFFPLFQAIFPQGWNLDCVSHLDPILHKPSAIDLQGILGWKSGIVNLRAEGL